jgi:CheY-like chemotaxis protein
MGSAKPPHKPPQVMVVEDEYLVRDMIVNELEFAGFQVLQAASAEDALAQLSDAGGIDLLFTDIRLPGMDGWQLARTVRGRHSNIPVIYASGYADRMQPLPHSKFLQKPYRPSQVLQAASDLGITLPKSA